MPVEKSGIFDLDCVNLNYCLKRLKYWDFTEFTVKVTVKVYFSFYYVIFQTQSLTVFRPFSIS